MYDSDVICWCKQSSGSFLGIVPSGMLDDISVKLGDDGLWSIQFSPNKTIVYNKVVSDEEILVIVEKYICKYMLSFLRKAGHDVDTQAARERIRRLEVDLADTKEKLAAATALANGYSSLESNAAARKIVDLMFGGKS